MILYPVNVDGPDGARLATNAKVYAAHGRTIVYAWDADARQVVEALSLPGTPRPNGFRQHAIDTEEGMYRLAETGHCGCGHPLKRWHPPAPVIA